MQGRGFLANVIGQVGPGATELAPDLLAAFGPKVAEPSDAAVVFSGLAPYLDLAPFLPHLDRLLSVPGISVVPSMIATGIARAGAEAGRRYPALRDRVPALCQLVLQQKNEVSDEVRDALEVCDPSGERVVAELKGHLSADDHGAQGILLTIQRYAGGVWREEVQRPPLRRNVRYARLPVWWKGPGNEEARRLLARMLTHKPPGILVRAAERLGKLGPAGRPYVAALQELLARKEYPWVRMAAARSLFQITGEQEPALGFVLEFLRDHPASGTLDVLRIMVEKDPMPAVAPLVRPLLGHPDAGFAAAEVLASLNPEDPDVLARLEKLLDPAQPSGAWPNKAALLMRRFRSLTPRILSLLRRVLASQSPAAAAETAGLLGTGVQELLPDLVRLLAPAPTGTSRAAALALLRLGRHTDAALAALSVGRFDRPDPNAYTGLHGEDRTALAFPHLLCELDEQPGESRRVLADALRNAAGPVRWLAAINLARWGECVPETVPVLAEAIRDDPPDGQALLRAQAARMLGELGPAALPALPALQAALPALRSWVLRGEVHRAIARLRLLS